jgi:chromosomal replication initiator protein
VVALTAESFVDRYAKAVRGGHPHTFRHLFQDCGLLLLDDLGFLATRSASQDQFFHIFHTMQEAGCSVAVTVDAALHTVSGLSPRVRSRLQAGLVTALHLPPPHERLEILRAKAARLDAPLPDPVIRLIADQPYETISELEGALNRLAAYADLTHAPLSVDAALEALYPLGRPQQEPQPDAILQAVCRHFHISAEQLIGPSRARHITYARHVAMYLLRSYGDHGLAQIGQLLGGRDHSTVLHAYRRIHRELTSLPQTRSDIDQLKTLLLKQPAA